MVIAKRKKQDSKSLIKSLHRAAAAVIDAKGVQTALRGHFGYHDSKIMVASNRRKSYAVTVKPSYTIALAIDNSGDLDVFHKKTAIKALKHLERLVPLDLLSMV